MKQAQDKSGSEKSLVPRIVVVTVLFGIAGYLAWGQYRSLNPPGIFNGVTTDFPMPNARTMDQLQAEFVQSTGITTDTANQLRRAFENNPREAAEMARKTLSMDQQLSAGLFMMAQSQRQDQKLSKMLSSSDFEALKARRRGRMGNMRRMWNRGDPTATPAPSQARP